MLPSLKKINPTGGSSFTLVKVNEAHFYPLWHCHPECEIMLIERGTGTCFAGDYIGSFNAGDIFLFGPNIPHLLRNPKKYFDANSRLRAKATVIYFRQDFWGEGFLNITEMKQIREILKKSQHGIILPASQSAGIAASLRKIKNAEGFERLSLLMKILYEFSREKSYSLLSSFPQNETPSSEKIERLNKASDFIMKNFHRKIYLKELADISYMSPTAFCRYFRKHTGKSLIEFLNEIRIGHACRLLVESSKSISEICYESGFTSVTNFNIQFKKNKKISPHEYQGLFR